MVATVGFFDGVHLGHQDVLRRLVEMASELNDSSVVITFAAHPDPNKPLLTTLEERKQLILECGVDTVHVLDFPSIQALTAREFMHNVLKKQLHVSTLLMGYDHRFGSDQITDFRTYQYLGERENINVVYLPQYAPNGVHISSSVIRCLVEQGDIDEANALLGYDYCLEGIVVQGKHIGRSIGFPTANIQIPDEHKLVAGGGVYVVDVLSDKWSYFKRGMLNIGTNPTVGGEGNTIEVHIFDFNDNLYGCNLQLILRHRLRGEIQFDTLEHLRQQLIIDKQNAILYER